MTIYFTGDIHADETRFSYKKNPFLKDLTKNDVIIQLGDFGCIWNNSLNKEDKYKLDFISSKPWNTIIVLGNHENYSIIETMPKIELYNGIVRQCVYDNKVYENIFFIDFPTCLNIDDKNILCIPKAESSDINYLLDPTDENFKQQKKDLKRKNIFYRVIGESWWPQEKADIKKYDEYISSIETKHFDYICSHDAPSAITRYFNSRMKPLICESTELEQYLEALRQTLNFDVWLHGHFHMDCWQWPSEIDDRIICLYHSFIKEF